MEVDHMAKKNPYLNDRDILDQALEHSWGKTADAKAKEKAYNREYYQRHKEEILRKARQAGEGIQRTAQNAYNTARREAQGIRDAVNPQPRRFSNPNGWTRSENEAFNQVDSYGAERRELNEARKNRNLAKNTPGAAEPERRYRNTMRARSQNAAAVNEALKDGRQLAPDSRFDSKLVRDAQNAYSKVRPGLRKAKNAAEDAINTAKNNAQAYIDNAMGKNGRRGSNIDTRQLEIDARKAQSKRNRINKSAQKASARSAARTEQAYQLNSDPKLRNGQFAKEALDNAVVSQRDAYEKAKMAKKARNEAMNSAAAYNQAQNAANRAGYDARYDSKLVRDFQNARAKARDFDKNPGKYVNKARDSVDQFVNNALSKTKKKKKS
jgi:hypothetical protein